MSIEMVSMRKDFPLEEKARDKIRAEIMDMYMIRAYQRAKSHMVSIRCERGDHRCHNSGISCLCLCHDRKGHPWEEQHGAEG